MRQRSFLGTIEFLIVVGLLAVPVGANFAVVDKWREPTPPAVPPTYLEPPP